MIKLYKSKLRIDSAIFYTTYNPVKYYDICTGDDGTFFVTKDSKRNDCRCHPLFQSYCSKKEISFHFVTYHFDNYTAIKK